MPEMVEEVGFSVFAKKEVAFQELAAKQVGFSTVSQMENEDCAAVCDISEKSAVSVPQQVLLEELGSKQVELPKIPRLEPPDSPMAAVEVISATDSSMCHEKQHLSVCVKEVQPPRLPTFDSGESPIEVEIRLPAPEDIGNDKLGCQDVVFVKESPLWKEVESMEIFRAIPQKPHFLPLLNIKEAAIREGVALGRMITFATLIQKASKLKIENPIKSFSYILDSLPELEAHGFDVALVKLRVEKLKCLKESQKPLLEKLKVSGSECAEHFQGLRNIRKDIEEIDKKMESLQKKKALLVIEEEKKESVYAEAREEAEGAYQGIEHTREEFTRLVASPW